MTTEIGLTCPLSWKSPCLTPSSKACSWKRCIKRKSNDGSGLQVEGFIMSKPEGGEQNLSSEPSWGTMPQISHLTQKDSCNVRKSKTSGVLQNEKLDKSSQSSFQASKLSQRPCVAADSNVLHLDNFTKRPSANCVVQSQHIQGSGQGISSKKRVHVVISEESACGLEPSHDKAIHDEIIRLREALKLERKALRKLHRELEEERCASAAAAIEAMAMIRRLQQEKSAALVESRHYRLASEERETYNQEAIALLKEALSVMENEVSTLQERVEFYRRMLLKMNSGQGNHLEGNEEEEKLLFLQGSNLAPSNEFLDHSQLGITDGTKEQALADIMACHHYSSEVASRQQGHDFEDTYCESHKSNDASGAQDLDDVSISILDRVARLEERFACLGGNQAFESDCSGRGSYLMARSLGEAEAVRFFKEHSSPEVSGSWEQDCGFSPDIQGAPLEALETKSRGYSRNPSKDIGRESEYPDTGVAKMENVRDVFEIQCDLKTCAMPPYNECKSGGEKVDVVVHEASQVSDGKPVERRQTSSVKDTTAPINDLEGCTAPADAKSSAELRLPDEDGEAIKSFAATDDVHNLKLRLQALEGERAFMKVAIDSLRKENVELKLLHDIAQQLRDLKGDVWKVGSKGRMPNMQSPILSFLQGILSFVGMQSNAATKKRRFFSPCQESSKPSNNEQEQAGLVYLLNCPWEEERHMHVMRECKVKLGSA